VMNYQRSARWMKNGWTEGGGGEAGFKAKKLCNTYYMMMTPTHSLFSLSLCVPNFSVFFFIFLISKIWRNLTHTYSPEFFKSFFSHFPPTYLPTYLPIYLPTYPLACHGWFSSSPHYLLQCRYPSVLGM
jgi:hypothetical protein